MFGCDLFYLMGIVSAMRGSPELSMLSKPFLTTQEIAELFKVREQTVRGWIHGQELRSVKLGREFRVAVKDLEAFVNEHATRAPSREDDAGPTPS